MRIKISIAIASVLVISCNNSKPGSGSALEEGETVSQNSGKIQTHIANDGSISATMSSGATITSIEKIVTTSSTDEKMLHLKFQRLEFTVAGKPCFVDYSANIDSEVTCKVAVKLDY